HRLADQLPGAQRGAGLQAAHTGFELLLRRGVLRRLIERRVHIDPGAAHVPHLSADRRADCGLVAGAVVRGRRRGHKRPFAILSRTTILVARSATSETRPCSFLSATTNLPLPSAVCCARASVAASS